MRQQREAARMFRRRVALKRARRVFALLPGAARQRIKFNRKTLRILSHWSRLRENHTAQEIITAAIKASN